MDFEETLSVGINQIVPNPKQPRKTLNEEKMVQLVESIKGNGLLQPIKVRPFEFVQPCVIHGYHYYNHADEYGKNDTWDCCFYALSQFEDDNKYDDFRDMPMFEVVYGHRRLEACKRLGWETIPAIIEEVNDADAQVQALLENIDREDQEPLDIAYALHDMKQLNGWNNAQLGERLGKNERWIRFYLRLVSQPQEVKDMLEPNSTSMSKAISPQHIENVDQITRDDETKIAVLKKAQVEQLPYRQTRKVAEAIREAGDDERAKEALLAEPYTPLMHDPEIVRERKERFAKTSTPDPLYIIPKNKTEPTPLQRQQSEWDRLPRVQVMLDHIKKWDSSLANFRKAAEVGKVSPEGKRFIVRRLSEFARKVNEWSQEIEDTIND
jgi:ParB family chromosome partitioning protein